jgi:hypothetical protein
MGLYICLLRGAGVMEKSAIRQTVIKLGGCYCEDTDYVELQAFTSSIGRLRISRRPAQGGFTLHEAPPYWLIGFYSPQFFLAKRPSVLPEFISKLLLRELKIDSRKGLALEIIQDYELEDWTDRIYDPLLIRVFLCDNKSFSRMEDAEAKLTGEESLLTKQDFLDRIGPYFDRVTAIPFNGFQIELGCSRVIIRFLRGSALLRLHEMLVVSASGTKTLTDEDKKLVGLIREAIGCIAFTSEGLLLG